MSYKQESREESEILVLRFGRDGVKMPDVIFLGSPFHPDTF